MTTKRVLVLVVAVVGIAALGLGLAIYNDYNSARREISDLSFRLSDLENVLRGTPNAATIQTVRQRLESLRGDMRTFLTRHQLSAPFLGAARQELFDRFGQAEARLRALGG